MIAKNAKHPNCMYKWMDHMASAEANGQATVWFGEAPTSPQACDYAETLSEGHCERMHATDEAYFGKVWYWATPQADCADTTADHLQGPRTTGSRPGPRSAAERRELQGNAPRGPRAPLRASLDPET